jgi:sugar phosphate isomerase/epimerase
MKRCLFVLSALLSFTAPLCSVAQSVGTSPSFKGPVGLQLYSLRDQIKQQGAAALDFVKAQGFVEVEIGLESHYGLTAEAMKAALDARGLKPIAAHASLDFILSQTEKAVAEAKRFGIQYVGVAWAPHKNPLDEQQVLKIAEGFNQAGKLLKAHGIQFFYHNHGFEFQPYKDGTLFDLLVQKTAPDLVKFEMDVLWVIHPGQDPVTLLKKYPNRWALMHLKDLRKGAKGDLSGGTSLDNDVALGSGQADYAAILKAAQKVGVKHFFIEDESPVVLQQIPSSLKFLSSVAF